MALIGGSIPGSYKTETINQAAASGPEFGAEFARTAFGLQDAAFLNVGTAVGTVAAGNDLRFNVLTGALQTSNNLSEISAPAARTNLGLGSMATQNSDAVSISGGTISVAMLSSAGGITTSGPITGTSLTIGGGGITTSGNVTVAGTITAGTFAASLFSSAGTITAPAVIATGTLSGASVTTGTVSATNVSTTNLSVTGQTTQNFTTVVPLNGTSITIPNGISWYAITPAGPLSSLTVILPASPINGQDLWINTTQFIAGFTLSPNAGYFVNGAPTALEINTAIHLRLIGAYWVNMATGSHSINTSQYFTTGIAGNEVFLNTLVMSGGILSPINVDSSGNLIASSVTTPLLSNTGPYFDQSSVVVAATSAATLTIPNNTSWYVLTPATILPTLTINMPAVPQTGHDIWITTTNDIIALTLNGGLGTTIGRYPTFFGSGTCIHLRLQGSVWINMGTGVESNVAINEANNVTITGTTLTVPALNITGPVSNQAVQTSTSSTVVISSNTSWVLINDTNPSVTVYVPPNPLNGQELWMTNIGSDITTISYLTTGPSVTMPPSQVNFSAGSTSHFRFSTAQNQWLSMNNCLDGYIGVSAASGGTVSVKGGLTVSGPITLSGANTITGYNTFAAFKYLSLGTNNGLTATGVSNASTALPLTYNFNLINTVPANSGVKLPATNGMTVVVVNEGANTLTVWPPTGAAFDGGTVNAPLYLAPGAKGTYIIFNMYDVYSSAIDGFTSYAESLGCNGNVIYSTNTTLTSANSGQIVTYYGTGNATFTLPMSASGAPYKMPIIIHNASLTYTVTVNPQSADGFDLSISNSTLYPLQNMALINDGTGNWTHLWNDAGTTKPFSVGTPTASNHAVSYGSLASPPPIGSTAPNNGSFLTLTAASFSTARTNNTGVDFQSSATAVPTSGSTVTLTNGASWHVIAPTGSLAALTLTIPSAPSGVPAGQIQPLTVFFSQAVTTVTWSGAYIGPTLPTTITQGQSVRFIYNQNLAGWFHTTQV